jgi:hypothetical protein
LSRQNIYVLFLMMLLGIASSRADVFEYPLKDSSRPELEKSLAKVMDYNVASGDFKQTKSVKKIKRDFVSTGVFRISKENGIIWKTQKPIVSELAVNKGGVFERDAKGVSRRVLSKENPVFADFSSNIQSLLSGNISELEKNFKIFYERQKCGFKLGLVPREGIVRKAVANIVLDACENVDKVTVMDNDGSPVTYEFLNYKTVGKSAPVAPAP